MTPTMMQVKYGEGCFQPTLHNKNFNPSLKNIDPQICNSDTDPIIIYRVHC